VILRDLRVLAVLPTGTDSSLCSLRLPDDLPTGSSFGSGDGAGNRTQHARRTSPAMENATADRSGRSERCREPWRLPNGAVSGPGVCGRTTKITRLRPSDCDVRKRPIRNSGAFFCYPANQRHHCGISRCAGALRGCLLGRTGAMSIRASRWKIGHVNRDTWAFRLESFRNCGCSMRRTDTL
jgi:hypothetical protein